VTFLIAEADALDGLMEEHRGEVVARAQGELAAAFGRPSDAAACALEARRSGAIARGALDTCELGPGESPADPRALEGARRLFVVARNGLLLCSDPAAALLARQPGIELEELGTFRLDGAATERVHLLRSPGETGPAPSLAAERAPIPGLPLDLTRFFGREEEIARITKELQGEARLLTITGPGGMGKTRLALEALRALVEPFRGAVAYVPLAEKGEARAIPAALVEALGLDLAPSPEPLGRAIAALSRRPTLLVLDNLEHLVAAGAALARTLLERVPSLRILVTSRQRLGVEGERELPLEPLEPPDAADDLDRLVEYPSVALFVDRAQAAQPDFQVTRKNAHAIAGLVRRLEGIPLALGLAGGRAQVFSAEQILERIDERLDLLASRVRGIPPRQRTLRAAVEWSHNLLGSEQRRIFARLSVFRGSFTVAAASVVCDEPGAVDLVAELRDASLLASAPGPEPRFRMLETLRTFAREQLGVAERAALEERHASFFRDLAGEAARGLAGPEQVAWLERLAPEQDDFRAALAWSKEKRPALGLAICAGLWRFWAVRGPQDEGLRSCSELLALERSKDETRLDVLLGATTLACRHADPEAARGFGEEALALARRLGDRTRTARTLAHMGNVEWLLERFDAARARHEEALAAAREIGDSRLVASALGSLGHILLIQGDFAGASPRLAESLANFEKTYAMGASLARAWLGQALVAQGEHARARTLLEQGIAEGRALGGSGGAVFALNALGDLAERAGDDAGARALHAEAHARGEKEQLGLDVAIACAALARLEPRAEEAHAFLEAGLAAAQTEHGPSRLGQGILDQAQGCVLSRDGRRAEARTAYEESLRGLASVGERARLSDALVGLATLDLDEGVPDRAARLLAAAFASRCARGQVPATREQARLEELRRRASAALGARAFERVWREGLALSLDEAAALATRG
jgi:predicted ATPase